MNTKSGLFTVDKILKAKMTLKYSSIIIDLQQISQVIASELSLMMLQYLYIAM
jgi:hypothetical protein